MKIIKCKKCMRELEANNINFYERKKGSNTFIPTCKECFKKEKLDHYYDNIEKYKTYYILNKDRLNEYSRNYNKDIENRVRISKIDRRKKAKRKGLILNSGGFCSKEQWLECLEYFNYKCCYSGKDLSENNLSIDHIIPISKNGTNDAFNVICCDKDINSSKCNKDMEIWFREQPYFTEEKLDKIKSWINMNKDV